MNYRVLFVVSCKIRGTKRGAKPTTREKESTTRPFVKPGPMPPDLCPSLPATLWTDLSPPLNSFSFGQPLSPSLLIIHLDYRSVPNFVNEKWNVQSNASTCNLRSESLQQSLIRNIFILQKKTRTKYLKWVEMNIIDRHFLICCKFEKRYLFPFPRRSFLFFLCFSRKCTYMKRYFRESLRGKIDK